MSKSTRVKKNPQRIIYDTLGGNDINNISLRLCNRIKMGITNYEYIMDLLYESEYGSMDNIPPDVLTQGLSMIRSFKSSIYDPDTPNYHQEMVSEHREEFKESMREEIIQLENHNTWDEVGLHRVPEGVKIIPTTWAFKIKKFPDGRKRKFKSRFCVRGDLQEKGIDFTDKYSPVVSWSTVRLMMTISLHRGWKTKQIDFENSFVQDDIKEDVYIKIPPGFCSVKGDNDIVLKLRKSLYGLVQEPKTWYQHLKENLLSIGLIQSKYEQCLFYGENMILVVYVDDVLVFKPSELEIDSFISCLKEKKLNFTLGTDLFSFLGVEVVTSDNEDNITLLQKGLIKKVIETVGMTECNTKENPTSGKLLGTDLNGPKMEDSWNYASVIGMLMYLDSN